ncbi:MAG: hypothetical protein QOD90_3487 [Mycobacterium sp.]|jgi:hypothetical protein|nr:hypothetical protein [Mycobacterium sp.]
MNSKRIKVVAASIGAGALIASGTLVVATTSSADPAVPGPVPTEEATLGETTTETTLTESTPAETPTTTEAVPPIEGPATLPPEQDDAL